MSLLWSFPTCLCQRTLASACLKGSNLEERRLKLGSFFYVNFCIFVVSLWLTVVYATIWVRFAILPVLTQGREEATWNVEGKGSGTF
jgi:hypothetical protein